MGFSHISPAARKAHPFPPLAPVPIRDDFSQCLTAGLHSRCISSSPSRGLRLPPCPHPLRLLGFFALHGVLGSGGKLCVKSRRGGISRPWPPIPTPEAESGLMLGPWGLGSHPGRDVPSFPPRDVSWASGEAPMLSRPSKSLEFSKSDMLISVR